MLTDNEMLQLRVLRGWKERMTALGITGRKRLTDATLHYLAGALMASEENGGSPFSGIMFLTSVRGAEVAQGRLDELEAKAALDA